MKKLLQPVIKKWYWFLLGAAVLGEAAVFLFFGENSYIAVHDNLDLFMGHFMAMKHSGTFFAHDAVPILGGITRDYLSSEFSLYNILFLSPALCRLSVRLFPEDPDRGLFRVRAGEGYL